MPRRVSMTLEWTPLPSVVAQTYFVTAEKASHLEEPLVQATQIVSQEIAANFDAQGRPEGWQELNEATVERRGSSEPILFVTGNLYNQATSPTSWAVGGGGQEWDAELIDVTDYGRFHVTGTVNMPVRDWTFVPDDALDAIEQVFW